MTFEIPKNFAEYIIWNKIITDVNNRLKKCPFKGKGKYVNNTTLAIIWVVSVTRPCHFVYMSKRISISYSI